MRGPWKKQQQQQHEQINTITAMESQHITFTNLPYVILFSNQDIGRGGLSHKIENSFYRFYGARKRLQRCPGSELNLFEVRLDWQDL